MDRQIEYVVTGKRQLVKMVVDCQGKVSEEAGGSKIPDCLQVPEVTDGGVIKNTTLIIKMERGVEGVGVDEQAQNAQGKYR